MLCTVAYALAHIPLSASSEAVLYADDLLLFHPIHGMEDFHYLQHDISAIEGWVSSNYLTLNSTKSKYMIVSRKANPSSPAGLPLGNSNLEKVECFKYLGLLLSSKLTFSQHIASICTNARRITGLYRRFYHNANSDSSAIVLFTSKTVLRIRKSCMESLPPQRY